MAKEGHDFHLVGTGVSQGKHRKRTGAAVVVLELLDLQLRPGVIAVRVDDRVSIEAVVTSINADGTVSIVRWTATRWAVTVAEPWLTLVEKRDSAPAGGKGKRLVE